MFFYGSNESCNFEWQPNKLQHAVRKIQGQDTVNMGQEKLQLVISIKVVWTERKKRKEEIKEYKYNKAFYI